MVEAHENSLVDYIMKARAIGFEGHAIFVVGIITCVALNIQAFKLQRTI